MTERDRKRYSRQVLFAPLGEEGQRRLLGSRAVVVGCGALGSFHVDALARAGVGSIVVIDRDYVEESNLQRQWLFDEADAEQALPKAVAAARRIARVNSSVNVEARIADLTADNAEELLLPADVILDGTDNFETRYLINDVAVKHRTPWIYGAAVGAYGVTMPILPQLTACLTCIFPEPPGGAQPTCDTAGVLNSVTALIAALQVADAIKILAGRADAVRARMLSVDVWEGAPREVSTAERDPDCPVCAHRRFSSLDARGARRAALLCGRDAVQISPPGGPLDLNKLRETLEPLGEVRANEFALRFRTPPYEMTVFSDGRAIIKGVREIAEARSFYARYVGS